MLHARRAIALALAAALVAAPLTASAEEPTTRAVQGGYPTPFPPVAGRQTLVTRSGIAPGVPRFVAPAEWVDGDPVPAGFHTERRTIGGLVAGGLAIFGGAFLGSALLGLAAHAPAFAVPVAGPFIAAAQTENGVLIVAGAADCLLQLGGLVMAGVGAGVGRTVLVPDTSAKLSITPMVGSTTGAALTGTF